MLILFAAALAAAQPGESRSFDCAAARTRVERMICASEDLLSRDVALSQVYRAARDLPGIRTSQREWLGRRDACADENCVGNQYNIRIAQIVPQLPGARGYQRDGGEPGQVFVAPLGDGFAAFALMAIAIDEATGSGHYGTAAGVMRMEGSNGRWTTDACTLTFARGEGVLWVGQSACDNPYGVVMSGEYLSAPALTEITLLRPLLPVPSR